MQHSLVQSTGGVKLTLGSVTSRVEVWVRAVVVVVV